jgi:hypothetical protein
MFLWVFRVFCGEILANLPGLAFGPVFGGVFGGKVDGAN